MPENRRIKMTKRLMKDAFLELAETLPVGKISVTAVCKTADIHRSTFYSHYQEPLDILHEIENDVLEAMAAHDKLSDMADMNKFIRLNTDFFEYVRKNVKTFRILLISSENTSFRTRLIQWLLDNYEWNDLTKSQQYNYYQCVYIATGAIGMLEEWIKNDFPLESSYFSEMLINIILHK